MRKKIIKTKFTFYRLDNGKEHHIWKTYKGQIDVMCYELKPLELGKRTNSLY